MRCTFLCLSAFFHERSDGEPTSTRLRATQEKLKLTLIHRRQRSHIWNFRQLSPLAQTVGVIAITVLNQPIKLLIWLDQLWKAKNNFSISVCGMHKSNPGE
jgi:hypothetical protein